MRSQRGVSLIELMIGVAILSMLFVLGAPAFGRWMRDTQIRTAAESIRNGLQLARAEAVRRNVPVRFQLTSATGLIDWNVGCVTESANCPASIQKRTSAESSAKTRLGFGSTATSFTAPVSGGLPVDIVFNPLGRNTSPVAPLSGTNRNSNRIDVTNPGVSGARRLSVVVTNGGSIRMCDPALALMDNPQGCQ